LSLSYVNMCEIVLRATFYLHKRGCDQLSHAKEFEGDSNALRCHDGSGSQRRQIEALSSAAHVSSFQLAPATLLLHDDHLYWPDDVLCAWLLWYVRVAE